MATVTETPVNLRLKAADHVVKLGLWNEFKLILEHTSEAVPCLLSVSVELVKESDGVDDLVLIRANVDEDCYEQLNGEDRRVEWNWDRWFVENFPSDVLRQFCMTVVPVPAIEHDDWSRS